MKFRSIFGKNRTGKGLLGLFGGKNSSGQPIKCIGGAHPRAPSPRRWGKQKGRTLLEMLAVLAIIGVLSIAALVGFTYAMNKHRANETIYDVMLRGTNVPMIDEYYYDKASGYEFRFPGLVNNGRQGTYYPMTTKKDAGSSYYVEATGVTYRVCELILKMNPTDIDQIVVNNSVYTGDSDICGTTDGLAMLFCFGEDGTICDGTGQGGSSGGSGSGSSGGTSGGSGSGSGGPDDPCAGKDCGSHGTCENGVCVCEEGYSGIDCGIPPIDLCEGVECDRCFVCEYGECVTDTSNPDCSCEDWGGSIVAVAGGSCCNESVECCKVNATDCMEECVPTEMDCPIDCQNILNPDKTCSDDSEGYWSVVIKGKPAGEADGCCLNCLGEAIPQAYWDGSSGQCCFTTVSEVKGKEGTYHCCEEQGASAYYGGTYTGIQCCSDNIIRASKTPDETTYQCCKGVEYLQYEYDGYGYYACCEGEVYSDRYGGEACCWNSDNSDPYNYSGIKHNKLVYLLDSNKNLTSEQICCPTEKVEWNSDTGKYEVVGVLEPQFGHYDGSYKCCDGTPYKGGYPDHVHCCPKGGTVFKDVAPYGGYRATEICCEAGTTYYSYMGGCAENPTKEEGGGKCCPIGHKASSFDGCCENETDIVVSYTLAHGGHCSAGYGTVCCPPGYYGGSQHRQGGGVNIIKCCPEGVDEETCINSDIGIVKSSVYG